MLVQEALGEQLLAPAVAHSSMSVHVVPSPEKPAGQPQEKDPGVLTQVATLAQLWVPAAHSSMSVQVTPVPE